MQANEKLAAAFKQLMNAIKESTMSGDEFTEQLTEGGLRFILELIEAHEDRWIALNSSEGFPGLSAQIRDGGFSARYEDYDRHRDLRTTNRSTIGPDAMFAKEIADANHSFAIEGSLQRQRDCISTIAYIKDLGIRDSDELDNLREELAKLKEAHPKD